MSDLGPAVRIKGHSHVKEREVLFCEILTQSQVAKRCSLSCKCCVWAYLIVVVATSRLPYCFAIEEGPVFGAEVLDLRLRGSVVPHSLCGIVGFDLKSSGFFSPMLSPDKDLHSFWHVKFTRFAFRRPGTLFYATIDVAFLFLPGSPGITSAFPYLPCLAPCSFQQSWSTS